MLSVALIAGASSPLGDGSRWCSDFRIGWRDRSKFLQDQSKNTDFNTGEKNCQVISPKVVKKLDHYDSIELKKKKYLFINDDMVNF